MRINICSLFGAVLALMCLALPWSTQVWEPPGYTVHYYLSDEVEMRVGHEPYERTIFAMTTLIVGATVSLFTPLGGLILLLAVVDYFVEIGGQVGVFPTTGPQDIHFYLDLGFYMAIWATLLTCLSAIIPFGLGYSGLYSPLSGRKLSSKQRLLVWGSA
jgi:hypothetical protein